MQVEKEERGNKGAALTTFISLAGRFLVLMPNNPRAGGVSRRIEGEDRDQMREVMNQLNVPDGMGAIIRTAGVGRAAEELQWDLDNLQTQWDAIAKAAKGRGAPFLVYQESDAVTRALRDYLRDDIGEILVDDDGAFQKAPEYMQRFMPQTRSASSSSTPTTSRCSRATRSRARSRSAYAHKVQLPSGGSLVIDYTEALVSIDINSARATSGARHRGDRLQHQPEAAEEIARQLRIRDIGGLIVIDFIDMESHEEPARSRGPAARCDEDGPRAHPDRPAVALRPAGDVAPAPAAQPGRVEPAGVPALQRHRQHPQRRIAGAVDPAPDRRGRAQGAHLAHHRAGAGGRGHLPDE